MGGVECIVVPFLPLHIHCVFPPFPLFLLFSFFLLSPSLHRYLLIPACFDFSSPTRIGQGLPHYVPYYLLPSSMYHVIPGVALNVLLDHHPGLSFEALEA